MTKQRPSRPKPAPPPEGSYEWLLDDEDVRPARPRFTIWRAAGILGAMVVANMVLSFFFGATPITCLLTIPAGLVLYELWYILVEATA